MQRRQYHRLEQDAGSRIRSGPPRLFRRHARPDSQLAQKRHRRIDHEARAQKTVHFDLTLQKCPTLLSKLKGKLLNEMGL
jgi:hypothetical protein